MTAVTADRYFLTAMDLPFGEPALDRRERSFYRGLLPFVTIQKVPEKTLSGFQLDRLLLNVNTPEEWTASQRFRGKEYF